MSTRIHMRLDIKGCIRNRNFNGFISDSRDLSRKEAESLLLDKLSEGIKYLPLGDCDNFDPQEGCLGHRE